MKQIRRIMAGLTLLMLVVVALVFTRFQTEDKPDSREYKVEVNRIYQDIQEYVRQYQGSLEGMELSKRDFLKEKGYTHVKNLSYWKEGQSNLKEFFEGKGAITNSESYLLPLSQEETGYSFVRFEYINIENRGVSLQSILILVVIAAWAFAMIVLIYVQHSILRPFHKIEELPYELSKGHFSIELKGVLIS